MQTGKDGSTTQSNTNKQTQAEKEENFRRANENKQVSAPTTTTYIVVAGDSLSKIALAHYGDPLQWKLLAAENQIENPDALEIGDNLTIPNLERQTSGISSQEPPEADQQAPEVSPKSYTVISGDTLWEISVQFYGTGYDWYRIRDANASKVGLLASGRPLITPGTVLTIPV